MACPTSPSSLPSFKRARIYEEDRTKSESLKENENELDPVVVTQLSDDAQIHACLDRNVAVPSQRRNGQLLPPSQGATARDSRTNICRWLQTMARTVFDNEFVTEHTPSRNGMDKIVDGLFFHRLEFGHVNRLAGYMGGYSNWQANCEQAGVSLGLILIVTGSETKMEIAQMNAGPFI
ncbi:uncharacterized protein LOC135339094 isoform X2 [Halichondria panicea]|uniref:uncharacterized protein LOC135339094 isoform X2 n=1 Tax=Halichondria panicea TaxID=6063 RepID=UPI00312B3CF1